MDEITFCKLAWLRRDGDNRLDVIVSPIKIEGLTAAGVRVAVEYRVNGDYGDLWVDRHGRPVEIVKWRQHR